MRAEIVDAMEQVRRRTLDLVGHLSPADLERQVDPIVSPLVWDLAHIAAYEDLWLVHRFAGQPLLRPDLAARYDAFETPRTVRGEIEILDTAGAHAYLAAVRDRAIQTMNCRAPDPVVHDGPAPRAPAHGDDAPGDGARRPAARRRPGAAAA